MSLNYVIIWLCHKLCHCVISYLGYVVCFIFTEITCSTLPTPTNGTVTFTDGQNINSIPTYSCNAGFTLVEGDIYLNDGVYCMLNDFKSGANWVQRRRDYWRRIQYVDGISPKCIGKKT